MISTILFSSLTSASVSAAIAYALGRDLRQINRADCQECRTDALTGIGNRRFATEALTACANLGDQDDDQPFAVVMVDLDRFKQVNDTHGHHIGDAVLIEVARRLGEVCDRDIVARLGGDEFVIIAGVHTRPLARMLAAHVHDTLTTPMTIGDLTLTVGASVGVVVATPTQADRALKHADRAMYTAKMAGGGIAERVIDPTDDIPEGTDRPLVRLRDMRQMDPTRAEVPA